MKEIYCTYEDTEVVMLKTIMTCPYCGEEHAELDMDEPGKAYIVECEACEKEFKMYFDAS